MGTEYGHPVYNGTPYIPFDNIYIINESIRHITITLFIINCMNNLF